jgi:beta-glucosidase
VRPLGSGADLERAAAVVDANANGLYLSPVLHGRYPEHASESVRPPEALIADGDMETIAAPLDFLGVNYYAPIFLRAGDPGHLLADEALVELPVPLAVPGVVGYRPPEFARTPMGWLVDPDGLYELLLRVGAEAPGIPLYVTENGCAAEDYVTPEGTVNDTERVSYLREHLTACARAIGVGVPLAGYYVWSLLDNFEWGWGYSKRFGIIYNDFATQRRIPKASAAFYSSVARANALP